MRVSDFASFEKIAALIHSSITIGHCSFGKLNLESLLVPLLINDYVLETSENDLKQAISHLELINDEIIETISTKMINMYHNIKKKLVINIIISRIIILIYDFNNKIHT